MAALTELRNRGVADVFFLVCDDLKGLPDSVLDEDRLPLNLARYLFLDPHSRGLFLDWDHLAEELVGALRAQAGRDPLD
jgi:hypothetical protein